VEGTVERSGRRWTIAILLNDRFLRIIALFFETTLLPVESAGMFPHEALERVMRQKLRSMSEMGINEMVRR
jgi:hypothetical protein